MTQNIRKLLALVFAASIAVVAHAHAQQQRNAGRANEPMLFQSGALVALDSGVTLWIALINGKMQAIAADNYVIPRKHGFWRVRVDDLADPSGEPKQEPWAVPLKDSFPPQAAAQRATQGNEQGAAAQQGGENPEESNEQDQSGEDYETQILFLTPDYLSVYMRSGEYIQVYALYRIVSDVPSNTTKRSEGLRAAPIEPPISSSILQKTKESCAAADADFGPTFYEGAEESFAIRRTGRKWRYAWMFGYSWGAARGYHTECPLSVPPPQSMVGVDEFFPAWNGIKDAYPDADDAFTSPRHDLILIFYGQKLIVAPVRNGRVGKSVLRLEISGKPVMVQWATGPYVDKWTTELTPYFHPYSLKQKQ